MGGGVGARETMRTSGGKAAPSSRWPEVLFRVFVLLIAPVSASARSRACRQRRRCVRRPHPAHCSASISASSPLPSGRRSRACAPRNARARHERRRGYEAERYRLSESTLETILAAEPQALLTVGRERRARAPDRDLPSALGVPRDAAATAQFRATGSMPPRPASSTDAMRRSGGARRALQPDAPHRRDRSCRGRRTRRRPHHRRSRCAIWPGAGSSLPSLPTKHRQLEDQVASLRALLDAQAKHERPRDRPSPGRASRRASGASTGWPRPSPCSTGAEAHPFQSGLCRALAARPGMARHPSPRRRDPRPPPPGAAAARKGRLSGLEENVAFRLRVQCAGRGSVAPARRAHAARHRRQRGRRRASPISTRTSPSGSRSRAATTR